MGRACRHDRAGRLWISTQTYQMYLLDTDGKVIWRHSGPVDGDELRTKVLEHLGNYYKP